MPYTVHIEYFTGFSDDIGFPSRESAEKYKQNFCMDNVKSIAIRVRMGEAMITTL